MLAHKPAAPNFLPIHSYIWGQPCSLDPEPSKFALPKDKNRNLGPASAYVASKDQRLHLILNPDRSLPEEKLRELANERGIPDPDQPRIQLVKFLRNWERAGPKL
mmetsp:Transcript_31705/g.49623  ORF Transcript_31705/g.49623 Transcript_31705/m.49623 type:complete len:105 (+) Transcript_31705:692-1006(+)